MIKTIAKNFADEVVKTLTFGTTFSIRTKKIPNLAKDMKGIYLIYAHQADPKKDVPLYIGETLNCIRSRIRNHKLSIQNPEWVTEPIGGKFKKFNIDRRQKFDVWYAEAASIDVSTKKEAIAAETLLMAALKPKVWN